MRTFGANRGVIQTADGTVIARSVPSNDEYKFQREYPTGPLFSNITGFMSFNYGAEGLEREYNDVLTGKKRTIQSLSELREENIAVNNITLTAKNVVQTVAKEQLGNNRGAVVALNPKTGGILAMYSSPTYDPNLLAGHDFGQVKKNRDELLNVRDEFGGKANPMLNRPYRQRYFPGSTLKVMWNAAIREWKPEIQNQQYARTNAIRLAERGHTFHNFEGKTCGGDLTEMLRVSCNTGYIAVAGELGPELLTRVTDAFGFNQKIPFDMNPDPAVSQAPTMNYYNKHGRDYIGYNAIGSDYTLATPLQMALVASAFANNGTIMQPHLLKEVRSSDGQLIEKYEPKEWRKTVSPATIEKVKSDMINVVEKGSGVMAKFKGITIAGKTGTAQTQINTPDGKKKLKDATHAWFISFAPAEDPQVAVVVILEYQPIEDDATGGMKSAPIAREVIMAALGAQDPPEEQQ